MNKEIKDKWITALESGEYPQTKLHLKDNCGFCCLGVLTDLYLKEHGQEWESESHDEIFKFPDHDDYDLSNEVQEWAGIDSSDPKMEVKLCGLNESSCNISLLNDDYNFSFSDLAKLIREQL